MARRGTRKRSNFDYADKAAIYARDRATCAFSGKSLWLLDYGLCSLTDHDWVDHEVPCSRGGGARLENGACASYTYNSKKGDNGRDRLYLFLHGRPTEAYYDYFGPLPRALRKQLLRRFLPSDWYFNRCLAMLDLALAERYARSEAGTVRRIRFWQTAAWNRLQDYQRKSEGDPSMEARGLVMEPGDPGTKALLKLRTITKRNVFDAAVRAMYQCYAKNHNLHADLWNAKKAADRVRVVRRAERSRYCHPLTLRTLRSHDEFQRAQDRVTKERLGLILSAVSNR